MLETQVLKDPWVKLVKLVQTVLLVPLEKPVKWVHLAKMEPWELEENRDLLVQ